MIILAAESSAKSASCVICDNEKILGNFQLDIGLVHSKTLMPLISELLKFTGLSPEDIDLYAVSHGPGSFTGIRIGIAAVKGMAFAGNKPCAGVSTLEAMAENLKHLDNAIVCAVMDARCNQVYNAVFSTEEGNLVRLCEDRALLIDELMEEMKKHKKTVFYVGDGAEICYNIARSLGMEAKLAPAQLRNQNAAGVAAVALKLYESGETVNADGLLPVYLRLPQAEREYNDKKKREEMGK